MVREKLSDHKKPNLDRSKISRNKFNAKIDVNNGWTIASETKVEELGNESAIYSWLHKKSAGILSDKLVATSLAAAILSAISSAGSFTSIMSQVFGEDLFWLSISTSIIGALISLITTIILIFQKTYDYVGKIEKNKEAEQKYQWTNFKIQGQLQMPINDRENGAHFFGWISYVINSISHIEDIETDALVAYSKQFPNDVIPGIDGIRKIIMSPSDGGGNSASEDTDGTGTPNRDDVPRLPVTPANLEAGSPFASRTSSFIPTPLSSPTSQTNRAVQTKQLLTQRRERIMNDDFAQHENSVRNVVAMQQMDKRLKYEMNRGRRLTIDDDDNTDIDKFVSKEAKVNTEMQLATNPRKSMSMTEHALTAISDVSSAYDATESESYTHN